MIAYPYAGNFRPVPEFFWWLGAKGAFGADRDPSVAPGGRGFSDPTLTVERMLL